MKYYAIIGKHVNLIIGACTDPADVRTEEPESSFAEITKQEYDWISNEKTGMLRLERMLLCNMILKRISEHGRKFFAHNGRVSQFEMVNGRLWYRDKHSNALIYVSYNGRWRRFSEGGTLRSLIENLRDFILHRKPIKNHFGPWLGWICNGDLWGYGDEAMTAVRTALEYPLKLAARVYKHPKKPQQTA